MYKLYCDNIDLKVKENISPFTDLVLIVFLLHVWFFLIKSSF